MSCHGGAIEALVALANGKHGNDLTLFPCGRGHTNRTMTCALRHPVNLCRVSCQRHFSQMGISLAPR